MSHLEQSLLELIRRASLELSQDVLTAVERAYKAEDPESNARTALELIRENVGLAYEHSRALCPETVTVHFYVTAPTDFRTLPFMEAGRAAVAEATRLSYLDQGLVDPVTGKPAKTNVAPGNPSFHFEYEERKTIEVRLLLDSGIASTPGAQYQLPDESINATRDLSGVRRAALDTLIQTQGSGQGPGILGIGVGGDRASGYALAHQQLLRPLNERNKNKSLAQLETRILEEANTLGIGPQGFGGKTALLAVKIGSQACAASRCYVSVCYMGWACRRQGIEVDAKGNIANWLYDPGTPTPLPKPKPPKEPAKAEEPATPKKAAKKATKKAAKSDSAATESTTEAKKPASKAKKAASKPAAAKKVTKKKAAPASTKKKVAKKKSKS